MRKRTYTPFVLCVLTACGGFEAKPIADHDVLRELNAITLEALRPALASVGSGSRFDPAAGLSPDEAVAVALHLNPGLRAFRREREVAEGELIAAGLLPNFELDVTYTFLEHFTKNIGTSGFEVGLNWAPPRPGEIDAKETRARARIEEVRAQVAGEEWRVATETRKAYFALWAAEERLRLVDASLALRTRIRKFVGDKRALGDANRLDVNFAELEYVETLREKVSISNERDRARLELNRILGLPPLAPVAVKAAGEPLRVRRFVLEPRALEPIMIDHRPDLLAAKREYEQVEQGLRLAYLRRLPWFRFGPAFTRDELEGKIQNRFGLSLGLELPIVNQNQGEIAIEEARRDKLRQAFVERVHEGRAQVAEAHRNVRAQEALVRLFVESVKPALDENTVLTEAGFEKGEFNLVQLVTTQDKVLKSQRDFLEARLEYWRSVFDLERALGERFSEKGEE